MRRLTALLVSLSLLGPSIPAFAADQIEAPTELPCAGTSGKSRARCITDALKTWKELEHDYDEQEDERIAAWKAEHADMGMGADYQKLLRDFLNQVHAERKAFRTQLQAFQKAFFDEQKSARKGDVKTVTPEQKAEQKKLDKTTLEAAKEKCGPEDDDGLYRTCMRQLLRGVPGNIGKRSRTSTKLLRN